MHVLEAQLVVSYLQVGISHSQIFAIHADSGAVSASGSGCGAAQVELIVLVVVVKRTIPSVVSRRIV